LAEHLGGVVMVRERWRGRGSTAGLVAVASAVLAACGDAPAPSADRAFVAVGPEGTAIARLITSSGGCPDIEIDGRSAPMEVRAAPQLPDFPVLVCEAPLAPDARRASIAGASLPLPRPDPRRIAVVGDTGCRLEEGHVPQACNDPAAWPFAEIARAVADWQPDLIVHVGDYLYREAPCPEGDGGCAGSPWGYDWATIDADFFAPGAPLFEAAPLALTRGNHESCGRAGEVWFRLLDPRAFEPVCLDYTEPYPLDLGSLQLLMLDSSAASDTTVMPAQVEIYRRQFDRLREIAGPRAWLLTHRPMWVFGHLGEVDGMEVLFRSNPTLQAASESMLAPGVDLVLSGHVHLFELLSFDPLLAMPRPPQIVIGNGGTTLDPPVTTPLDGLEIAGATVAVGETRDLFGWVSLELDGSAWRATLRDGSGRALLACDIEAGAAHCGG
jgi:Calcineurin-like phosphoesterase